MDPRHDPHEHPETHRPETGSGGWVAPGSTSGTPESSGPGTPPSGPYAPVEGQSHWWPAPPGAPTFAEPAGPTEPGEEAPRSWWGEDPAGQGSPFGAETARRLSPRTLVVGPIIQIRGLLLPIAAGLVVGGFNPWILTATLLAVLGLLIGGFVTWKTFRYEIGEERLEIRSGLIRRSRRTIPLERVRGVDVTSSLLHRVLGVAVVRIEAASGAGETEDGKLDAVDATEAERLRTVLLHRKAVLSGRSEEAATVGEDGIASATAATAGAGASGPVAASGEDTVTYFRMPRSWYLFGALSVGHLVTPFVLLATLFGMVQQSAGQMATDFLVDWVTSTDRGFLVVFAAVSAGVLVLLMPVFAVVSYALTHWGFTLRGRDGSLVAERGLFTRRSVTLERRRIRGYELRDNPLERTRGAVRLRAIVTGLGDTANRAVLLPIGPRPKVEAVVDRALDLFGGRLTRHPRAALYRRFTRAVLPFVVVAAVALYLDLVWLTVAAGVLALLGVPLAVDRYRSLGHGYDGERVSVRSGSLQRGQATVERSAVIGWTWTQTLFQRRSGLADLQVTVGAGAGGYTAQDASLEESVDFAGRITPEMVRPFLVDDQGPHRDTT
ncbi:PH domain-containing protein [Nocardiopsis sp. NPDC055551]